MKQNQAAIGFRAKTGRAIAVALSGPVTKPALIWRREISLVDPEMPETGQPYHEVMELPWPRAIAVAERFVRAIEAVATSALASLLSDLQSRGYSVRGIAAVGSHDRVLEKIGNPHIRAHAAEGMLFRRVIEVAAEKHGLPAHSISDRTIGDLMAKKLAHLKALGVDAGPPWRADEKAATMGAWIALS